MCTLRLRTAYIFMYNLHSLEKPSGRHYGLTHNSLLSQVSVKLAM